MLFRDAYRSLKATPLVSSIAILSLTLGIGANTAIFSLLNSLLLKPLPVHAPGEIVVVGDAGGSRYFALSYPVWKEIRDRRVFDRAFAWATESVSHTTRRPILSPTCQVSTHRLSGGQLSAGPIRRASRATGRVGLAGRALRAPMNECRAATATGARSDFQSRAVSTAFRR